MKRGISMSLADVTAHNQRHGFAGASPVSQQPAEPVKVPRPRQNKTEQEYGLILEAMKRRGEVTDYRFEGISLAWGADPATGKPMYYTPDYWVYRWPTFSDSEQLFRELPVTLVECKGGFIRPQDLIRFKGCRAEWPMFRFELHQKTKEGWRQLL